MRRPPLRNLALLLLPLSVALGACNSLECGPGTHEEAGVCVANILTACGPGTVYSHGYCVPDQDAGPTSDGPDAKTDEVRDGQDAP